MASNNPDQAQTLDETLNRTDLGTVINDNKKPILIGAGIIVLLVIAFSIYKYQSNQQRTENLNEVYAFQSEVIDPYIKGEVDAEKTVASLSNMDSDLVGKPSLAPAMFEAVDKLIADGKEEAAVKILNEMRSKYEKGSYLSYFSGLRLAPIAENQGDVKKAISIYEDMVASSKELLEARIYLELGRLYLQSEQAEKAKTFLNHVVKNHESTEEAKLAKLYLQKVNGKK